MGPGIGSTVWLFDENRRVYEDGQSGPVYRGYFREEQIVGENRSSWILHNGYKIDKKTELLRRPDPGGWFGLRRNVCFSEEDVNKACWVHENRGRIVDLARGCDDYQKLTRVLAILEVK